MKIAVLGSTGMLGSMVAGYLGKNFEVVTPEFDAMAPDNGRLKTIIQDCQWVINAIGAIPQRCKDTPRFVALNANFPARLALAAENTGSKVIQIATDCIYDGCHVTPHGHVRAECNPKETPCLEGKSPTT